jgi:hypothetical protein
MNAARSFLLPLRKRLRVREGVSTRLGYCAAKSTARTGYREAVMILRSKPEKFKIWDAALTFR